MRARIRSTSARLVVASLTALCALALTATAAGATEVLYNNLNTVPAPLNQLAEKELCPGSAALDKINASLR